VLFIYSIFHALRLFEARIDLGGKLVVAVDGVSEKKIENDFDRK